MYLRYIHKLHDLHTSAENYTEAGFTMKLYADQLSWSSTSIITDSIYSGLMEWQVKEKLYIQIIQHFDKGKVKKLKRYCESICFKNTVLLVLGERCAIIKRISEFLRNAKFQLQSSK